MRVKRLSCVSIMAPVLALVSVICFLVVDGEVLAQAAEKTMCELQPVQVPAQNLRTPTRARRQAREIREIIAGLRKALQKSEQDNIDIWSLFRPNLHRGIRLR